MTFSVTWLKDSTTVLKDARILLDEHGWWQGGDVDAETEADIPEARLCLMAAVRAASGYVTPNGYQPTRNLYHTRNRPSIARPTVARLYSASHVPAVICAAVQRLERSMRIPEPVQWWNDAPGRTKADVLRLIDKALGKSP